MINWSCTLQCFGLNNVLEVKLDEANDNINKDFDVDLLKRDADKSKQLEADKVKTLMSLFDNF